jgi:hypothetical protein
VICLDYVTWKQDQFSSVGRCWLRSTEQHWNPPDWSQFWWNLLFVFRAEVYVYVFSWRFHLCSFIWGDNVHRWLKCDKIIGTVSWKNCHLRSWVLGHLFFELEGWILEM